MSATYVPGVCNIGPAEIRRRRMLGTVGAVATVLLVVLFVVFDVPRPIRLLAFIPAAGAAAGFLQAAMHFCARFGMQGLFNVGAGLGTEEEVWQQEYRERDRRKAIRIGLYSILIGVVVAVIAALLP